MAKNHHANRFRIILQLLQRRQSKHSRLAHPWFCLAYDISSHHSLWYALLLNFTWMLKPAICDSPQQLRLKQEVFEPSAHHTSVLQLLSAANLAAIVHSGRRADIRRQLAGVEVCLEFVWVKFDVFVVAELCTWGCRVLHFCQQLEKFWWVGKIWKIKMKVIWVLNFGLNNQN